MTEPEPTARLEAVVHGRVQGVGFRVFVLRQARALGLRGWVANEARDRVRTVAEGPQNLLEELLQHLHAGPAAALVDRVEATWPTATDGAALQGFEIRSGWHGGD